MKNSAVRQNLLQSKVVTLPSPEESAAQAGLSYIADQQPGISRTPAKNGFRYLDSNGKIIRDKTVLDRIQSLVIPPNWKNVWICRNPNGHLQATGRDDRNRKQYLYHPNYRATREQTKFAKMSLFGRTLPVIRRKVERDLSLPGLPKAKVLATIVRLMDLAHIRVGNVEYARENQSFGLTTMRNRHVEIEGSKIQFRFRGKSGKLHDLDLRNRRLAAIVKRCRELPGYELFQYIDETGAHEAIDSGMVNQYLREVTGEDITAKDFRTWHGTVHAAQQLVTCQESTTETDLKRNVVEAIKVVAGLLGNRPATCRKHYIHPIVIELYGTGKLAERMNTPPQGRGLKGLDPTERCVLELLRVARRLKSSRTGD